MIRTDPAKESTPGRIGLYVSDIKDSLWGLQGL